MELLILATVLFLALLLIPLGLPGTWVMVGAGVMYNSVIGAERVGWVTMLATAILAGQPVPANLKAPTAYTAGEPIMFEPAKPVNNSPNNTGIKQLPPVQPAFIWYPAGTSTRFPAVNGGGGRTAMAGPVYYYDEKNPSKTKMPKEYDHTLFIYEWSRNWIVAVHLDENNNIARNADGTPKMKRFCPNMTFKRPMDMELGADGCLYLIEFGTAWGNNKDTQIIRIEHNGPKEGTVASN